MNSNLTKINRINTPMLLFIKSPCEADLNIELDLGLFILEKRVGSRIFNISFLILCSSLAFSNLFKKYLDDNSFPMLFFLNNS